MVIRRRQVVLALIGSTLLLSVVADAVSGWFWLPAVLAGAAAAAYVTAIARLRHLEARRTLDEAFGATAGVPAAPFDWGSVDWGSVVPTLSLSVATTPDHSPPGAAVAPTPAERGDLARFLALWSLGWVLTPAVVAIRLLRGDHGALASDGLALRIIRLQEYGRSQSRRLLTAGAAASIGISALGALPASAAGVPMTSGRVQVSAPAPQQVVVTETAAAATTTTYQVRRGNTLWGIARSHRSTVTALVDANHVKNPNLIYPGQTLEVPTATPANARPSGADTDHVVRRGDTLFSLARRYGTTVPELAQANGIANPNLIHVGQTLHIPAPSRPSGSHLSLNPAAPAVGGPGPAGANPASSTTQPAAGATAATGSAPGAPGTHQASASTTTTTVAPPPSAPAATAPAAATETPPATVEPPTTGTAASTARPAAVPAAAAPTALTTAARAPTPPTTAAPARPAPVALSALPLPAQYLRGGTVDQGVDYAAPGGTPLYAMGPGKIIREGMSGFGPNAPVLQITAGPLAGKVVYYGHAGPDLVPVGATVAAGQQISIVGYGIVGISTGPHLEVGFYPPGPNGAGWSMLNYLNGAVGHSTGG